MDASKSLRRRAASPSPPASLARRLGIVRYLEREMREVALLQYDTRVPGSLVERRLAPHLHADVSFVDPWQQGGGEDRYRLGLRGFHAMLKFTLELYQVAVHVDEGLRTARVLMDGAMRLTPLPTWTHFEYALRTQLVYELDLTDHADDDARDAEPSASASPMSAHVDAAPVEEVRVPYVIRTHEEMWSFGDMLANLPLFGRFYRWFRMGFGVAFLSASYIAVHVDALKQRVALAARDWK